jgi:hypothetical protein
VTLPPLLLFLFLFLFLFLILVLFLVLFLFLFLHAYGVMVSHLFPAVDISKTALFVGVAAILGTVVPQVETKIAPLTTTMAVMNEMHHCALSTLPSKPCLREGDGDEGEGGGRHRGRQW